MRTTTPDTLVQCPLDRVSQPFNAERPSQRWVADFILVSTGQGWLFVTFVVGVFAQRITPTAGRSMLPFGTPSELIRRWAPWKANESVELATLQWVHSFDHNRLMESLDYFPPAEDEDNFYRQSRRQVVSIA